MKCSDPREVCANLVRNSFDISTNVKPKRNKSLKIPERFLKICIKKPFTFILVSAGNRGTYTTSGKHTVILMVCNQSFPTQRKLLPFLASCSQQWERYTVCPKKRLPFVVKRHCQTFEFDCFQSLKILCYTEIVYGYVAN